MKNRLVLLSIAVVATGLFVLPQTVSMFAGQHSWYDPKDDGIPCEKCHWLEYEELHGLTDEGGHTPHVYKNGNTHYFECEECHNVTMNVSYYQHTGNVGEHTPAHAATTVSCLDCHGGTLYGNSSMVNYHFYDIPMHQLQKKYGYMDCDKCHRVMPGRTFIENVDTELSNPRAAHRSFFLAMKNNSKDESGLSGANEACLGCHSRTGVNITWTRNQYVSYRVTCDKNGYNVSWNGTDDLGTNRTVFNSSSGWNW